MFRICKPAVMGVIGSALCFLAIGVAAGTDASDLYGIDYKGKAGTFPATVNGKPLSEGDLRAVEVFTAKQHGSEKGPDPVDTLIEQELFLQYAMGKNAVQDNDYRGVIENLFLSHLGMEYFDRKLKTSVPYDAAEVASILPKKWKKATVEFVLYPSMEEAVKAGETIKSREDFEVLKKARPEEVKRQENLFPESGFFPEFDDVAIFNMRFGGLYGALETGIGPGILYVQDIVEVGESEKKEMLSRKQNSVRENALGKEMERIQSSYPVEIVVDNVRKYIRAARGGYAPKLDIATVAGKKLDTISYKMLTKKEPLEYLKKLGDDEMAVEYENSIRNLCRTLVLGEEALKNRYSRIETDRYERSFHNLKRRYYASLGEYLATGEITVSDALVKKYYEDNLEKEFRLPESVRVAHIFKKSDRKKLVEAQKKIKAGEDFAELAMKYSDDFHSSMKGGDIEWIFKNGAALPEVEKAVFAKKNGGVTPIVKTSNGYHIFKVLESRPARTVTFEEAKRGIRKRIYDSQYEKKRNNFLKKMKKEAKIERFKKEASK